jgi:hypothetical protein
MIVTLFKKNIKIERKVSRNIFIDFFSLEQKF